ncbi:hypothetical protein SEA_LILMAC1015_49 [Arthrobacter phage Lilmac1015]|uniref:Uncharacterized protein n=1 Tax=Arthrobacter phage Lilmac1015 TaxID=2912653 RepID=A0AA49BPH0_9CAUD|nr:hypothetical protein SEA_LILMAC1015_49 [Arthrobacter phage Lilmac1015]
MSAHPELRLYPETTLREVDSVIEEIRERMCDRLDQVADRLGLSLGDITTILRVRQGESYAEDYEDWVLDSTTTDQEQK